MYRVPLPVPSIDYETVQDETGFTIPEKLALKNAWTIVEPEQSIYARGLFLDFFTANEILLERFRSPEGHFRSSVLTSHAFVMFQNVASLIYDGLESLNKIHSVVSPVVGHHIRAGVTYKDIEVMSYALSEFLKKRLVRFATPTLETSIDKLCYLILKYHMDT